MSSSKTYLVTGGTSGIGKEVALGLAKTGARVLIVGRNQARANEKVNEIKGATSNENVGSLIADLSSQESIRRLAGEVNSKYQRLDGLVNNAGVFVASRQVTVDGIEYTFALNHLAPFLLTTLLLELLIASGPSRIVTTSSIAHRGASIDFEDPTFEKQRYSGIKAYGQSKLANILFTIELARRLATTQVTANCFHPGGVRTSLMQDNPMLYRLVWALASPFLTSPAKGADTGVYLANSPEVQNISGKYFVKRRVVAPSAAGQDLQSAARLWEISEDMIKQQPKRN